MIFSLERKSQDLSDSLQGFFMVDKLLVWSSRPIFTRLFFSENRAMACLVRLNQAVQARLSILKNRHFLFPVSRVISHVQRDIVCSKLHMENSYTSVFSPYEYFSKHKTVQIFCSIFLALAVTRSTFQKVYMYIYLIRTTMLDTIHSGPDF